MQRRDKALAAIARQLLTGKPTRAALAWCTAAPLTPYPDVERELARCAPAAPLEGRAPQASLGYACFAFRDDHRIERFKAETEPTRDPARLLADRRLRFHEALHVLLEFDADWPGQLGVFSFVAAQRYCPQFEWHARALAQVYMTAAPWLRDALGKAEYRGRRLGECAPRLLTMPLEEEWRTPLTTLQIQLKLKRERRLLAIDWEAPRLAPIRVLESHADEPQISHARIRM